MMKILVLGASGFLGNILHKILGKDHFVVGTTTNSNESISRFLTFQYENLDSIKQLLTEVEPDLIVNCIALADVELAERNVELAFKLNFEFPLNLSLLCESKKIRLIHISTDHFESKESGLLESDNPIPVNVYGESKLLGDIAILKNSPSAIVVRTNFFGRSPAGDKGLIDFVENSLKKSQSIVGYQNIKFNPVGANFLGVCIHKLIHSNYEGIINIASPKIITKFEFLCLVASILNLDSTKITSQNYSTREGSVARPQCMALNTSECKKFLGVDLPSIESQLDMELSGRLPFLKIKEL